MTHYKTSFNRRFPESLQKNRLFCSFENKARLESLTTALEFLDDVCSSSLVTKGFSYYVITIKSIQGFVLVVMFYLCTAA